MSRVPLIVIVVCVMLAATATAAQQEAPPSDTLELRLPLTDGHIELARLADAIGTAMNVPAEDNPLVTTLHELDWKINVTSILGRGQLKAVERLSGGVLNLTVEDTELLVQLDRAAVEEQMKQAHVATQDLLEKLGVSSPDDPARFGMFLVSKDGQRVPANEQETTPERLIVLVHGLDDPGWMWDDMIPALRDAGYDVAQFEYPNDGPISESTDLLALSLIDLHARGTAQVDVVAHSMGGLVARDLLTRMTYYNGDGAGDERLPAVDRLIMIGTPNHGSHMAHLRMLSELQEHLSRLLSGDHNGGSRSDGRGEAGIDLLPRSDFLRRLNNRPLASHTKYTIIAAKMSPIEEGKAVELVDRARELAQREEAPSWLRDLVNGSAADAVPDLFAGAVRGLGDGVVTLDSSRLEGVDDFVIVHANHMSMVARVVGGPELPPSIPIVLDRLSSATDDTGEEPGDAAADD